MHPRRERWVADTPHYARPNTGAPRPKRRGVFLEEREQPGYLDDWIEMEGIVSDLGARPAGARFVKEYSYRHIKAHAQSPLLIPLDWSALPEVEACDSICMGDGA